MPNQKIIKDKARYRNVIDCFEVLVASTCGDGGGGGGKGGKGGGGG